MGKIDRRHVYGIVLDTETANTIADENGLDKVEAMKHTYHNIY